MSKILENTINAHNNNYSVKVDYTNTGESKNTFLVIGSFKMDNTGIKIIDKIKCTKSEAIDIINLLNSYDTLKGELEN